MPYTIVIPARFASTRLPGKPLLDIAGLPMVVRVAKQAQKTSAKRVLVATDHDDIALACTMHDIESIMTPSDCATGTDRLAYVATKLQFTDAEPIINIQGDEPLIEPLVIEQLAQTLTDSKVNMATCARAIHDWTEFINPNVVKVVCDNSGHALYFSRAPIPFPRDTAMNQTFPNHNNSPALAHIGIYAYRAGFLQEYTKLTPTPLETLECLEQLRVLAHGHRIKVCMIQGVPAAGVDTLDDLERVRALCSTMQNNS